MVMPQLQTRSVVPQNQFEEGGYANFILWLGSIADDIQPWGGNSMNFRRRDVQLRQFWMNEPILASALYTISIRDASFSWTIKGDQPRTVKTAQSMLHNADLGKGWLDFIQKWRLDFLTQDNGAHFELIRQSDSPNSPVIGINHLDSGRCRRTGVYDWPIIYTDRLGSEHKLKWYQVISTSDMPSPIETANGIGFCAVSRVLREAQFQRDVSIRSRERSSGMDPNTLHLISGITRKELEGTLQIHKDANVQQGYIRYNKPVIFTTVDPTATVNTATLDLAPEPKDFKYDERMQWYISLLAMAIGVDYQDLAPLPSRGIGGTMQSMILHQKSKGKGPELFMKTIEHLFNFHGVLPNNVTFEYDEKDSVEDQENADLFKSYSEAGEKYVNSGVLTGQSVRNIMLDAGVISQEIFGMESAGQPDATDEIQAESDERNLQQTEQSTDVSEKENLAPFVETQRRRWEDDMYSDIRKGLNKIYRDIRDRLLPKKAKPDYFETEKFWEEFRKIMVASMAPNTRQVFLGAAEANAAIGLAVDMDAMNLAVYDFTREYMTDWLAALESTTRDGLRKAVLTWQEGGLGTEGLPDLVKSLEPLFGEGRARRIAQTETTRVFDLGNLESHRSAGIEYERWETANDDKVREEHQQLQGQVFRLGEGPRPSDYINCRCARVPIPTEDALRALS